MEQQTQTKVVVVNQKSVGLAFLLAFLFGPLGLLYCSVVGALLLMVLGVLSFLVLPVFGLVVIWIISIIWAVVAATNSKRM
jgi:hypothetical protein